MNVQKSILILASTFLLLAIALGAFGAHGLKQIVDATHIETFKTGVQYQFYHGIAILVTMILLKAYQLPILRYSIYFFILGILLFSGSLYLLTFNQVVHIPSFVGPLTPIGGFCFIIGWFIMVVSFVRR